MPVHFIDNYAKNNLNATIVKQNGSTLFGEVWVYEQFLAFNENKFLQNETWYLKHNYNLSTHPASKNKVEGQIDFLLLSKNGILIIEVKGGGIRVDENDCYYSFSKEGEYQTQNPFTQAKEYVHSLKNLIDKSNVFIYRAIVFPHEAGFELRSIQLMGYKDFFISKRDFGRLNSDYAINKCFFDFIFNLGKVARRHNIRELNPSLENEKVNKYAQGYYPELSSNELRRLKSELFPVQSSYGYNPDRINNEIILNENYEILQGLRRNNNVMVQGAPGTGKTILAQKFLAENLLKQNNGLFFCSNKLLKARLEHIILREYNLDPNFIKFRIYSETTTADSIGNEIDFLVFDEAQEYFDKGLFDLISETNKRLNNPKILILYDPEQSIISNFKELAWYTDYFVVNGYAHYYFDEVYRCIQHIHIAEISKLISANQCTKVTSHFSHLISNSETTIEKLKVLTRIIDESRFHAKEKIILVVSPLIESFRKIASDFFIKDLEELEENNINIPTQKIRYTTPLKYRGLENKCVYLITDEISEKSKVQNFVGITRAMESINIILWR